MIDTQTLERELDRGISGTIAEWSEFLGFPSISADPAHEDDCRSCAAWLADHLDRIGLAATVIPTGGKPLVFAERRGSTGAPTLLFYGHYDVQPVDPLAAWTRPPFEPAVERGRMRGRGAADDKGQVMCVLKAFESLIRAGVPLPTIKVLIEGEEEDGSDSLREALPGLSGRVGADVLLVCDGQAAGAGTPAITMGLRGLLHVDLELAGASRDLHSGSHGGLAPNPAIELGRLIGTLHREDGGIAAPGFYDGAEEPSNAEKSEARAAGFDRERYIEETGIDCTAGEEIYAPRERVGFRPALDVTGFWSGYCGPGLKTIIPATARVRIAARLVDGQDPRRCLEAVMSHLRAGVRHGMRLRAVDTRLPGGALRVPLDSPWVRRAREILDRLWDRKSVLIWEGGSVPIVPALAAAAGAEPLLAGFGMEEDRVHAPNESFALDRFRAGYLFAGLFAAGIGADPPREKRQPRDHESGRDG